jgi:hypothetical protein
MRWSYRDPTEDRQPNSPFVYGPDTGTGHVVPTADIAVLRSGCAWTCRTLPPLAVPNSVPKPPGLVGGFGAHPCMKAPWLGSPGRTVRG